MSDHIVIPEDVVQLARRSVGAFFQSICPSDPDANIRDFLDLSKSFKRAEIVQRYTPLRSRKVLEIGSGFGTNLAAWIKSFEIDGYGVEPSGPGFDAGFIGSQKLFAANGIDPSRIQNATGESLPFPDNSFDIVYSANVLEHTKDPELTLEESIRVLRPGGTLHMEMPNFLSYYEGHYLIFQPPILWRPMLPWLVRWVYRRDPAFARSLQTQINPVWCRRQVRRLSSRYPVKLVSLGEELFLDRLSHAFQFEMATVATRLGNVVALLQAANYRNWIGRAIVALKGHYPIYLTVRKDPAMFWGVGSVKQG
ncbi:MAG: class I SAM-dependent methyltransferase [Acidobacteriota bacterium]|nr:class I SAM-dependent methyltransferase [Acidobacteriota bacterium]